LYLAYFLLYNGNSTTSYCTTLVYSCSARSTESLPQEHLKVNR